MTKAEAEKVRARIVAYCEWGIRNAVQIHYAQIRPIPVATPKRLPLFTDCSGFATLAYKSGGGPDPNGANFNGTGYTGTLKAHGRKVATPLPGDLIFYPTPEHVCVFMEVWHGAWIVCSHGQEIGPLRMLNHREELAHLVAHGKIEIRSYLPR